MQSSSIIWGDTLPRKPAFSGLLTDELRTKFFLALRKADANYRKTQRSVSKEVQRTVFATCADFNERCAFRRYLVDVNELRDDEILHEQDLGFESVAKIKATSGAGV